MHNKKYYTLEDIVTYEHLWICAEKCYQGKKWKDSAVFFHENMQYFIPQMIREAYSERGYQIDRLNHATVYERGKARFISSNIFKDRVMLKCFNQYFMLPAFVPTFVYDNGASLKGKGVDFSLHRLEHHLQSEYSKYGTEFYFLKTDIKKYFDSMYHPYIMAQIKKYTRDPRIIKFFEDYLYVFEQDPELGNGQPGPVGVGLGSEVIQSCGLLYLSELDHLFMEKYRVDKYERYQDDIIAIHHDKEYLKHVLKEIKDYTENVIKLELSPNKTYISHISRGIVFLKIHFYITDKGKILKKTNKKTLYRIRRRLTQFKKMMETGYKEITPEAILMYYNATCGCLKRSDSKQEKEWLDSIFMNYFGEYFEIRPNGKIKVKQEYKKAITDIYATD